MRVCEGKLCVDKLCEDKLCDDKMCVSKLCDDKMCDDKMCEDKWCVSKLCEDKLCVSKLCVNKLCEMCEDKLCASKWCEDKLCVDKLMTIKMCEDKLCVSKWCEDKLCVDKLCVEGVEADDGRRTGGGREADGGIQNQKQEPHTKMWGINRKKGGSQMEHPPTVRTLQCGHAVWRIYARIYRLNAVPQKLAARACAVEMHLDICRRAILCENLQEQCRTPEVSPTLCASLPNRNAFHDMPEEHFMREISGKMPRPSS